MTSLCTQQRLFWKLRSMRPGRYSATRSAQFCLSFRLFCRRSVSQLLQFSLSLCYRNLLQACGWLWIFRASGWHWWLQRPVFVRKWSRRGASFADPSIRIATRLLRQSYRHYLRVCWITKWLYSSVFLRLKSSILVPCHDMHISFCQKPVRDSRDSYVASFCSDTNVSALSTPGACAHMPSTCRGSRASTAAACLRRTTSDTPPSQTATCSGFQRLFWVSLWTPGLVRPTLFFPADWSFAVAGPISTWTWVRCPTRFPRGCSALAKRSTTGRSTIWICMIVRAWPKWISLRVSYLAGWGARANLSDSAVYVCETHGSECPAYCAVLAVCQGLVSFS